MNHQRPRQFYQAKNRTPASRTNRPSPDRAHSRQVSGKPPVKSRSNAAARPNYQKRRRNAVLALLLLIGVLIFAACELLNKEEKPTSASLPAMTTVAPAATTTAPSAPQIDPGLESTVPPTATTAVTALPDSAKLDVKTILQNPELPTGCEVTSLAALLNYLGYSVTKTDLADNFLPTTPNGGVTFDEYFVGSPYIDNSFGCYAPVIVRTAEAYFKSIGETKRQVKDLSGSTMDALYGQVAAGNPVIIWSTMKLQAPKKIYYWSTPDGTPVYFYRYEHCVLLTGYDKKAKTVTVCDPMEGTKTREMPLFEQRYQDLLSQAVVITT